MLGGMFSSCACAMCLRTVSEYWKRSAQMRQCHWSRAEMYGRHSGLFGSSLGLGIFKSCKMNRNRAFAQQATGTIPIVADFQDDPVATGLISGLAGRATKNVSPVTASAPTALARLHPHAPLSSLFLFSSLTSAGTSAW